ncbi:MAG: hypothetical protein EOP45_23150, partial [Sphingobacteriaceae bacterium]
MIPLSYEVKQFLQSSQPSVVLGIDAPVFTIAHANDAYCELSGSKLTDMIGKGLLAAFPQNPEETQVLYAEQVRESLLECLNTKKQMELPKQRYDLRLPGTKEFVTRHYQATNTPILNREGDVSYILHQVIDITTAYELARKERISFEVAEAKSIELEKVFMEAPAGVVVFSGPNFVFDLVNPTYQSFFPDRQLMGKPLLEALPELQGHPLL